MCVMTATVLIFLGGSVGRAQNLAGRSRIELGIGMAIRSQTSVIVGADGVVNEVDASGLLTSIGFGHWFRENLAGTARIGVLALDIGSTVGVSGVTSHTAVVTEILLGVRYYFPESTFGGTWRPYGSIAAGPVIGTESEARVGMVVAVEETNETAFGGRIGAGVDINLSRSFMLGILTGYNLMTDFSNPVGARVNHSGPDFGVSISLLLGRGDG